MGSIFDQGHALIVGVGGADDLPDTVTDAKGIAGILTDPGRCAYPKEQVKVLTGPNAGRKSVLKGLDSLAGVPPNSSVIVYFSGHGVQAGRGKKKTYYLMPHGYDIDNLKDTAISGAEFADKLGNIPAERMLVLLDCCHAGGFDGAQLQKTKSVPKSVVKNAALPPEATEMLSKKQGRVLIASSKGSEVSYPGHPYSAFTTALIAALCGEGNAKEDSYVRVVDLALYTREAVVKLTEYEQTPQHPTMDFEKADNFVVAYYAAGEKKTKGLPASIAEPKIQTAPGAKDYNTRDQQTWNAIHQKVTKIQTKIQANITNISKVTNTRRDTKIVHGDNTELRVENNSGFMMFNTKANTINNLNMQDQPPARRRRQK